LVLLRPDGDDKMAFDRAGCDFYHGIECIAKIPEACICHSRGYQLLKGIKQRELKELADRLNAEKRP
jgi:hypothetical protein